MSSIREELEAAMGEAPEVEETPEVEAPEVETPEPEKAERERDESGKFVKKEDEKTDDVPRETSVEKEAGSEKQTDEPEKEAPEVPDPPLGWSAEAKAKWHELDPDIRAAVAKREEDVAKFTSKSDEQRQLGIDMQKTLQPYMAQIQAEGGTPVTAVQNLLNTAYLLRSGTPEQKKALILQTAQQFGVDLSNTEVPQIDPTIAPLYNRLQQLEGMVTNQSQASEEQLKNEVQQEIEAFRTDPANSFFEKVQGHMSALLHADESLTLKDAYDQACWANPDIRATLQARERAAAEEKRKEERRQKAEAAKRKGGSLSGGPGTQPNEAAPENASLRDELEANWAASQGAV